MTIGLAVGGASLSADTLEAGIIVAAVALMLLLGADLIESNQGRTRFRLARIFDLAAAPVMVALLVIVLARFLYIR